MSHFLFLYTFLKINYNKNKGRVMNEKISTTHKSFLIILNFLILLFLSCSSLFISSSFKKVNANEQACDEGCASSETEKISIVDHPGLYQTFTAEKNRLTQVGVWLTGKTTGAISLRLYKGSTLIDTAMSSTPAGYALVYFDFGEIIEIVPGSKYSLKLSTIIPNTYWMRSEYSNCYTGGQAYVDGVVQNYDFGFLLCGYNYGTQENDVIKNQANEFSEQTENTYLNNLYVQEGVDFETNYGAAPSENVLAAIESPTNLIATKRTYKAKPAVTLSWEKSDSFATITGYKVFRKTGSTNYKQIAQTTKSVLKIIDTGVEEGGGYSYMVRAYKGIYESPNSNAVSIVAGRKATALDGSVSIELELKWSDPWVIAFFTLAIVAIVILIYLYAYSQKELRNKKRK